MHIDLTIIAIRKTEVIAEINELKNRLQPMIAIISLPYNMQKQVDSGRCGQQTTTSVRLLMSGAHPTRTRPTHCIRWLVDYLAAMLFIIAPRDQHQPRP